VSILSVRVTFNDCIDLENVVSQDALYLKDNFFYHLDLKERLKRLVETKSTSL
jgi:hypothetical protein